MARAEPDSPVSGSATTGSAEKQGIDPWLGKLYVACYNSMPLIAKRTGRPVSPTQSGAHSAATPVRALAKLSRFTHRAPRRVLYPPLLILHQKSLRLPDAQICNSIPFRYSDARPYTRKSSPITYPHRPCWLTTRSPVPQNLRFVLSTSKCKGSGVLPRSAAVPGQAAEWSNPDFCRQNSYGDDMAAETVAQLP